MFWSKNNFKSMYLGMEIKPRLQAYCRCLIVFGLMIYCLPSLAIPEPPVEKVALQLKWFHAFQFAGYYAAKEKGFYTQEGLDVEILPLSPKINNIIEQVLKGKAEYGVAGTDLLAERLKGQPVVILAAIFQHNPLVYFTLKSSGIFSPYELKGKKVMDDDYDRVPLLAMLYEAGVSPAEFTHVDNSFNPDDLITGKVDAVSGYLTNQLDYYRQKQVEINIIDPHSYGVDFLGDNLFTTEQEIEHHPERTQKFLRASLKGWDYALKHTDEIIDLILKKYNTDNKLTAKHLRFEADATLKMISPDSISLGSADTDRFQAIAQTYHQLGLVKPKNTLTGFIYRQAEQHKLNLTPDEKAWLQAHPVIRVGIDKDFAPYEWIDSKGNYVGVSADYMKLIGQTLGVKFEIIKDKTWTVILDMAKRGELDMLASANQTPERDLYLNFTEPYIESPSIIINHAKNGFIGSLDHLKGKRVAVEQGYFIQELLAKEHPQIQVIAAKNTHDALAMVNSGSVDAYIGDAISANYALRKEGMINLMFSGDTGYKSRQRMVTTKTNAVLTGILAKALDSIPDFEKETIENRWMSIEIHPGIQLASLIQYGVAVSLLIFLIVAWNLHLHRDIKRRKQMAAALLQSETRFQTLYELSGDAVVMLNEHSFFDCNKAALELFGCTTKEEFCSYHPADLSPPLQACGTDSVTLARHYVTTAMQNGSCHFEWLHKRADTDKIFPTEVTLSALVQDKELVVQANIRDITERKRVEKAMQTAQLDAISAHQAKSEFLANMSHEIRTPMNGIMGMTHLLQQSELTEKQKNYLNTIDRSANSLLQIINGILDFSTIEAGKLELKQQAFLLVEVINNLLRVVELKAEQKGIELYINLSPESRQSFIGDPLRLGQILLNLLNNAIKFTDKGKITLAVTGKSFSDNTVKLQFSIQDTGIGMSSEQVARLFHSFSQADTSTTRKYGGTGLGLVIARQLTEMMKGHIWVESELGKGSTFYFTVQLMTAKTTL